MITVWFIGENLLVITTHNKKGEIFMVITIDLSKSDLERIHDTLGIDSYDDIHAAFIEAIDIMLEKEEEFSKEKIVSNDL